jgi:hypothetical protein
VLPRPVIRSGRGRAGTAARGFFVSGQSGALGSGDPFRHIALILVSLSLRGEGTLDIKLAINPDFDDVWSRRRSVHYFNAATICRRPVSKSRLAHRFLAFAVWHRAYSAASSCPESQHGTAAPPVSHGPITAARHPTAKPHCVSAPSSKAIEAHAVA